MLKDKIEEFLKTNFEDDLRDDLDCPLPEAWETENCHSYQHCISCIAAWYPTEIIELIKSNNNNENVKVNKPNRIVKIRKQK